MPVILLCLLISNKNCLFCLLVSNKSIIFAHVFIFSVQLHHGNNERIHPESDALQAWQPLVCHRRGSGSPALRIPN